MKRTMASLSIIVLASAALALLAFASGGYAMEIFYLKTLDLEGRQSTVFKRGDVVVVETKVRLTPTYYYYYWVPYPQYLEIIQIWHGYRRVGLLLTRAEVLPGEEKTFGGGIAIRRIDPIGTYLVEVMVWNCFPSEAKALGIAHRILAEFKTITFEVKE